MQGAPKTTDQLTGMVYEQFLSADLRELQMGCLPPQLAHETKYMLQGVFCLQVSVLYFDTVLRRFCILWLTKTLS